MENNTKITKKKRIDSTNLNEVFLRLNHPSITNPSEETYLKNEISSYLNERAASCSKYNK
jgi:hypothetical protein